MSKIFAILLTILLASCSNQLPPAEAQLARACAYLWEQQDDDGGWHSKHHGLLKGGEAWTPFVLFSLMNVADSIYERPEAGFRAALKFMRGRIDDEGAIGRSDADVLEYPNYASAYALRIFRASDQPADAALVRLISEYLRRQQFTEKRGILPEHSAYGSWGFGETTLKSGQVGHVDLSHTRRVLQALPQAAINHEARIKSRLFLRMLQKQPHEDRRQPINGITAAGFDGGFYFSSTVEGANKGGSDSTGSGFRSYATATCDGILALLAAGAASSSQPVEAAAKWLEAHPVSEFPAGIPRDTAEEWHKVLFFYHLAVRSEVYRALDWPGNWRSDIYLLLKDRQAEDGSFQNPYGALNKEDDPLLATALAIQTLQNILKNEE